MVIIVNCNTSNSETQYISKLRVFNAFEVLIGYNLISSGKSFNII